VNVLTDLLPFELFVGIVHVQGSDEGNQHSVIEDLPAASLLQTPGARADAATWCDESGYVWLFGGEGYDDDASGVQPKLLNDLWMFNTSQLEWNVMHLGRIHSALATNDGENTTTALGERCWNDTAIAPEPRKRAVSCGVPGIVFVIFGGIDSNGSSLSDTWIFNIQQAHWLLFSDVTPTVWSTNISWCHLDALYVIGSSTGNTTEMWKFCLRTLEWTNESMYLADQQHCADNYLLPAAQSLSGNAINVVWDGMFYLYQWQIMHSDNDSNSLTFSVDLLRWQSLESTKFMNNWHSIPILWLDLKPFNEASILCSSSVISQELNECSDGNGESCNLHRNYQITSSTSWSERRHHTSSWFYEGKMYIFGGEAVGTDDSKTFYNDLHILQLSFSTTHNYTLLIVISFVSVLVLIILLGFCAFIITRYCDYRRGRKKSRELRTHYMPLIDQSFYD